MIHNNSSDPVLIKKISLKVWSLRDEIESRIQAQVDQNTANGTETSELDLMKLREEYTHKNRSIDNVLSLKSATELDTGEDEMARAMAQAESEEATNEATSEAADGSEAKTENVLNLNNGTEQNDNIISISLEAPKISEDKVARGKTVLSEISMDKMFFFCNKSFTEGQSIVIQFCIPKSFIVNADILYCRPFNLKSRIISQNNYTHRALIRFNFLKEGERALLRQFLQSVEPVFTKVEKKAEAPKEEGGGDFNDLDDLGL